MTEPGLAIARPLRIRIQVVLYRSDARLRRLLPALDHLDTAGMSVELHFLNNSPGDGTEAVIASHAPRLAYTYRDSPRGNIGFGAGHNLLALDADAPVDFILLLNPDTIPFDDLLVRLVDAARDRPRGLLFEAAQFPVEHPKEYDPENGRTRWCCAACLMVRSEAFSDLGGFDERLFLYCEDVDLSWRAWAAGWECVYVPAARCVHISQEEDLGKDRGPELHHMSLGDLYLRRKWFDEVAVNEHVEHLRVCFGDPSARRWRAELDAIGPPPAVPGRPPQAMLLPDHLNYAPTRW